MPIEKTAGFLNVDLIVAGRFDRKPLLRAAGKDVFVMHEDAVFQGKGCIILEAEGADCGLEGALARLLRWVERLPRPARRSWAAASRRVFDVGIQAGLGPHETHWTIPSGLVAALARVGGEVAVTVYGARWRGPPRRPG